MNATTRAEARALLELAGKATPGLWHATNKLVRPELGFDICDCWDIDRTPAEAEVNANFIASAPRLAQLLGQALDALEEAERNSVEHSGQDGYSALADVIRQHGVKPSVAVDVCRAMRGHGFVILDAWKPPQTKAQPGPSAYDLSDARHPARRQWSKP